MPSETFPDPTRPAPADAGEVDLEAVEARMRDRLSEPHAGTYHRELILALVARVRRAEARVRECEEALRSLAEAVRNTGTFLTTIPDYCDLCWCVSYPFNGHDYKCRTMKKAFDAARAILRTRQQSRKDSAT